MPRVSIIVPCRNEEQHLAAFAASALAQKLPEGWTLEIVIADGMSDDGTRRALDELAARDPRVAFVDNPERIVSSGLNRALARRHRRGRGADGRAHRVRARLRRRVPGGAAGDRRRQRRRAVAGRRRSRGRADPGRGGRGVPVALGGRRRALAPARLRRPGRHRLPRRLAAADLRALRRLRRGPGAQPGRRAQPAHRQGRRPGLAGVARSAAATGRGRRSARCSASTCSTATGSRS